MGFSQRLSASLLLLCAASAHARLLTDGREVVNNKYDFIVVGAGTSGCVVANRLSESASTRVLLIEAGIAHDTIDEDTIIPAFGPNAAPNKPWTWNFTVTPQTALNHRTFPYPRGRLLGGSSAINYVVYNRGGADDYDRWANVTGDKGWSFNSMQPFMLRNEKLSPPADKHNTDGMFIPSAHGFNGTLHTTLPGFPTEIDSKVIAATSQVPGFGFNEDMDTGNEIGIGWVFASINQSKRDSSATAYLSADVIARPNLDVLITNQVTKIINTATGGGVPAFTRVEFAPSPDARRLTVTASKEVILSAGAVGSPQLMLLSGIGDRKQLGPLGISTILHLPDVGKNLQDHALLPNQFLVNSHNTHEARRDPAVLQAQLDEYHRYGTGPLVDTICNTIGWFRIPDNSPIFKTATDPSAGPTVGHYEWIFINGFVGPVQATPETGNFLTVLTNIVAPGSRGSVRLNSKDPWDSPLIDPGFLTAPIDLVIMRTAVQQIRNFLRAPAWDGYIIAPFGANMGDTDEEIDAFIRRLTTTVWHPTSTAAMSPANSSSGVTDPDLTVKGVTGLRVIDASVFPFIPSAHTEAPVYYVGERGADLIKTTWKLH